MQAEFMELKEIHVNIIFRKMLSKISTNILQAYENATGYFCTAQDVNTKERKVCLLLLFQLL